MAAQWYDIIGTVMMMMMMVVVVVVMVDMRQYP